jgi:hypothetical protein
VLCCFHQVIVVRVNHQVIEVFAQILRVLNALSDKGPIDIAYLIVLPMILVSKKK